MRRALEEKDGGKDGKEEKGRVKGVKLYKFQEYNLITSCILLTFLTNTPTDSQCRIIHKQNPNFVSQCRTNHKHLVQM